MAAIAPSALALDLAALRARCTGPVVGPADRRRPPRALLALEPVEQRPRRGGGEERDGHEGEEPETHGDAA